jgi:transcriptional regulator with XRE-family HTH domain
MLRGMEPAARLARAVRRRRDELSMSLAEVAAAAREDGRRGLSIQTIRAVEAGERASVRPQTARALARALRWPDDAVTRVLTGEDIAPPTAPADRSRRREELDALAEQAEALGREVETLRRVEIESHPLDAASRSLTQFFADRLEPDQQEELAALLDTIAHLLRQARRT